MAAAMARVVMPESDLAHESVLLLNSVKSNEQHLISTALDRGADVHFHNQDEQVQLRTPLRAACSSATVEIIRKLLKNGASVFAHFSVDRWTALHSAAHKGHDHIVRLLLNESEELHENCILDGFHLMHLLAECVSPRLLNAGADLLLWTLRQLPGVGLDARSTRAGYIDWTPLHICCARGMTNAAVCLLRAGAVLASRTGDFHVRSPKLNAFCRGDGLAGAQVASFEAAALPSVAPQWLDRGLLPLHLAAFGGHMRTVQMLLKHAQAVNGTTLHHRWTPLMFAIWRGHVTLVRELCRLGARAVVNLADRRTDGSEWTPLSLAVAKDTPEMVESLLAYAADPLIRVGFADFPGRALIDHAAPMLPDASANTWSGRDRNVNLVHIAVLRGSVHMLRLVLHLVRSAHARPVRTANSKAAIATVVPWQYPIADTAGEGGTRPNTARSPRSSIPGSTPRAGATPRPGGTPRAGGTPRGGQKSLCSPPCPGSPEGSRRALESARAAEDKARQRLAQAPIDEGQDCDPVTFTTTEGWSPAVLAILLHVADPVRQVNPELLCFWGDPTVSESSRADVFLELLSTERSLNEDRAGDSPPIIPQRFQNVSETLVTRTIDEFVRLCKIGGATRAAYRALHSTLCVACSFNRQLVARHLLVTGLCDPRCKFVFPVQRRPLHVAASSGFGYLAQLLLEYRADPLEKDERNELPVYKLTRFYAKQVTALQNRVVELEGDLREARGYGAPPQPTEAGIATSATGLPAGFGSTAELTALLVKTPPSSPGRGASPRLRCSPQSPHVCDGGRTLSPRVLQDAML